ncbi:site-specific integrase [Mesobacterium pallidum]|uniref:site-specific integrase n=1 Tax=Mesobacterium pallidum TaxID=2872037 RepID=UPI001EE2162B|nr:site-specific integrase [Mesobacterium pallidum]
MDHTTLRAAVMEYFRSQLDAGKLRRDKLGPFSEQEKESTRGALDLLQQGNAEYWKTMGSQFARDELNRFFSASGLPRGDYDAQIPKVLNEIRLGRIGAFKEIAEHGERLEAYDFSEPRSEPLAAHLAAAHSHGVASKVGAQEPAQKAQGPLLSQLFSDREAQALRAGEWAETVRKDYASWVHLFLELAGDRPILSYQKTDAREFKAVLQELPANRQKYTETQNLPPREAVAAAKRHGLAVISTNTVNKALGRLQSLWTWADKQLDETVPDIFGPMKVAKKVRARDEADPFSKEQLQTIFSSPLFTGCKSERFRAQPGNTDMTGTSWFWLPLLGLYTGARLNELCQLRQEDVDEEDGIPFLHLREGDDAQRIKTGKARKVPIHPQLVDVGFLRYAAAVLRAKGADRVFPTLTQGPNGYFSDRPSKDFSNYLKTIGAKTEKTSFHSFRHGFKDACRRGRVMPDIADILQGHSLHGMAGRYGAGDAPLPVLLEAMERVSYPNLSLQQVWRHP